ncbi:MAG TPA: glycosyltransferase family 2 protein [Pyrinomonadaceae bacterium]|nr:glycosyltransferase family 2 protein [Pyrinomonadaceae bacterium]
MQPVVKTAMFWPESIALFMFFYYFLAAIVIWLGLQSLLSGLRYSSYVRRECALTPPEFTPFVSVIAPSRGLDPGLKENLTALFVQDYPNYEIVFVTGHQSDPSVAAIEEVRRSLADEKIPTTLVFAGQAIDSGQKVHNLRHAVTGINPRSEVMVFVDVDARPETNWLRSLVAPLHDERVGAATGYRWYLSRQGGLASQLLSVWNASIASALGERSEKNFCWGGSTAIRRYTFEKLKLRERWRGTVSDDFTLMRVLREANLPIKFVPACLTASFEDYHFQQLFEFTTRQLQITRVYAPQFWQSALAGGVLFNSFFFGGLALVVARMVFGYSVFTLLILLGIVFILGAAKAYVRWHAVSIPLAGYRTEMRRSLPAHILLWPFGSLLFLYNATIAAFSRRIVWRGIGYELKSPTEAVIISRE